MALTNEDLDKMQDELKDVFNSALIWKKDYKVRPNGVSIAECCTVMIGSAQTLVSLENEKRLREDYKPRKTLQKD
jgi:hypothetical protein